MTSPTWHASDRALLAYTGGAASPAEAAGVEAHLLTCAACRAAVADRVAGVDGIGGIGGIGGIDRDALDAVWDRVAEDVLAPAPPRTERLLRRLGLPARDALVAARTPFTSGAWLLGVALCVVLVLLAVAVTTERVTVLYLQLAPLVPLAAVALAYGQVADPDAEAVLATPYPPLRLLLLRSLTVVAVAAPVTALVGWLLRGPGWMAAAWLLPGLACACATLALATWLPLPRAAAGVGATWALLPLLLAPSLPTGHGGAWIVLTPHLVTACLLVAAVGALVFWRRSDRVSFVRRTS